MIDTLERMARPKKPPTTHIRIRRDLSEMLEIIAAQKKMDIPELMDDLFRQHIRKEYALSLEQLQKLTKPKEIR